MKSKINFLDTVLVDKSGVARRRHRVSSYLVEVSSRFLVRYSRLGAAEGSGNAGLIQGGAEATGFIGIPIGRYLEYYLARKGIFPLDNIGEYNQRPDFLYHPNLLKLTNTKYIVASNDSDGSYFEKTPSFTRQYQDNLTTIYLYKDYLNRVLFIPSAVVIKDKQAILDTLKNAAFNPQETVILEEDIPNTTNKKGPSSAQITSYAPQKVEIALNNTHPGFLLLLDTNYPGWHAYIDNKPTRIYQADYLYRGIYIPQPGSHKITFKYIPKSFIMGAIITFVTLVACAVVLWRKR